MQRFRMTPQLAAGIASRYGFTLSGDFHALHSDAVAGIIAAADAFKYRHRRGANGSRGIPRARYCLDYWNANARHAATMSTIAALRRLGMIDAAKHQINHCRNLRIAAGLPEYCQFFAPA